MDQPRPGGPCPTTSLLAVEVDGDDLLGAPVGEPQPAVVPAGRLDVGEPAQQDPRFGRCDGCVMVDLLVGLRTGRYSTIMRTERSSTVRSWQRRAAHGSTATTSTTSAGRARKRRAIIDAATTAFLRNGYRGTSMDEIAAVAGVSKQTVYKHFADKERLFSEIVITTVNEASDPVHERCVDLQDSGDIEADLRDLARRQLALVMQPRILQLRRLVIGEAGRFPELGRTFYEQGPGRTIAALATTFERLAARGLLRPGGPAPRGRAVQLADHVGAAEPGDAPRRRRPARPGRHRPRGPTTACARSSPPTALAAWPSWAGSRVVRRSGRRPSRPALRRTRQ